MTREAALASSTGWVNDGRLIGYLSFQAANLLVSTGQYVFVQCCPWGYILDTRCVVINDAP